MCEVNPFFLHISLKNVSQEKNLDFLGTLFVCDFGISAQCTGATTNPPEEVELRKTTLHFLTDLVYLGLGVGD